MTLDEHQSRRYQEQGFLVIHDVVPSELRQALRDRALALVRDFDPDRVCSVFTSRHQGESDRYFLESGDQVRYFFEEGAWAENGELRQAKELSINKIGHALHEKDEVFASLHSGCRLFPLARSLGYQDPRLVQSMYIFKQPRIGGEVVMHQDATFLYSDPVSVTGLWFALEDATRDNGCLWVLPGGHRLGLKRRFLLDSQGATGFEELDETPFPEKGHQPVEVPAGALVVLHGLLPHYSGPNHSDRSRHAYTLHLMEGALPYPANNWLQRTTPFPRLAAEL